MRSKWTRSIQYSIAIGEIASGTSYPRNDDYELLVAELLHIFFDPSNFLIVQHFKGEKSYEKM
jgi:hypothetical protein